MSLLSNALARLLGIIDLFAGTNPKTTTDADTEIRQLLSTAHSK
jgi:hypothetical protein